MGNQCVSITCYFFLFFHFVESKQHRLSFLWQQYIKLKRNSSSMCVKNDGIDKHFFYLFKRILSFCMHCTQRTTGASRVGTAGVYQLATTSKAPWLGHRSSYTRVGVVVFGEASTWELLLRRPTAVPCRLFVARAT